MKNRILILFVILALLSLCLVACYNGPGVNDLQALNDLLQADYSAVTVVSNTKIDGVELNGNFALTFDGDETNIAYSFDKISSFEIDDNGNIADTDADFIETVSGIAVVRDGKVVDGDDSVDLPLSELTVKGFSFKQAFFSNATLQNAKFEADVVNPQQFTGNLALNCTDMHIIVIRNTVAKVITSLTLSYTSENGAQININYVFTK